jgi:hypothetical protein
MVPLLCLEAVIAGPQGAVECRAARFEHLRITGSVLSAGEGIEGVSVTDGLSVVRTGPDGSFELASSSRRRFVYISLPAGYEIPTNPSGTALFYKAIRPDDNGEMRVEFTLRKMRGGDGRHAFLLMADPQTRDREDIGTLHAEAVPDIMKSVRELSLPSLFGVACGDIMYDSLQFFPEYERAVSRIGIPCFQVLGNHDVDGEAGTDEASVVTFQRCFGPPYYSFNRGEIHYVVLDDVFWFGGYIGYIDQIQFDWLEEDLSHIERGSTIVVFVHIPPYNRTHIRHGKKHPENTVVVTNRTLLYNILEPFKAYIICGHMHQSEYLEDHGAEIHICGALCGAWWTGSVCEDGTPMGYAVYEVDGSEISWRYKSLGSDIDHQMRLYPPGSDDVYPDDAIANIWSADMNWRVYWYEDGVAQGHMQRRVGMDPLAERLYRGGGVPEKHPWVEPVVTDHLFYAKPSAGAKEITVEAIDQWGRTYRETIELQ